MKNADSILAELYGETEIERARRRYAALIEGMPGKPRIFSAPGRTELAGNHTDHNRGKVLAASIQLDNAAAVCKSGGNTVFFRSAGFPDVKINLADLPPRAEEKGTTEALIRGIAAETSRVTGKQTGGFTANAASDVLPGSGLSSSAALEVLLARIFDLLYCDGKLGVLEIARIGQAAENAYFGKPCGLMDQIACAQGGTVAIDFKDETRPVIKQIDFDPALSGYALCVVNTGGSHADLTADYASIPAEMKAVAAFFGKTVLGEVEKETVMANAAEVRKKSGDRALLRALHFFDENARVDAMVSALAKVDKTAAFNAYLELVNESGESSSSLLQNVYPPLGLALALTKEFFKKQKISGACRVHGGGFAGTIQAYIPFDIMNVYRAKMEAVFGADSVKVLRIRKTGVVEIGDKI
jgi:galactokinase